MIKELIILASAIDLLLSYVYVRQFRKMFPKLNWQQLEANPIIRLSWNFFGFGYGYIFSAVLIIVFWIFLVRIISINWLYFSSGLLSMMIIYHFLNFSQLKTLEKQTGGKDGN